MNATFYWYDFESSGTDPAQDRALQFAGVRTDLELNPIGKPLNLFCFPGDDLVPVPEAIQVTGIKISELQRLGVNEAEFARQIHAEFAKPGTCVLGFNTIRFDDEFSRHLFYRNFYDPYAREWQGDNSRWDVIDLFRMAYALRPDGFAWPMTPENIVSFKLERLTQANHISHAAHDALADVYATIAVTKKLRQAQPKLYDYSYNFRHKKQVLAQLCPLGKQALVHVSSMYAASRSCLAVVLPLCVHPTNPNRVICFDLTQDPTPLLELGPDELYQRVFTPSTELEETERVPLKTIHINRCPALAPLSVLKGRLTALSISLADCEAHQISIQQTSGIVEKISAVYSMTNFPEVNDPDLMLYQGDFFKHKDRAVMAAIHDAKPQDLAAYADQFEDTRLPEMLFRYRARNYPNTLTPTEKVYWAKYRHQVHLTKGLTEKIQQVQMLLAKTPADPALLDLQAYLLQLQEQG